MQKKGAVCLVAPSNHLQAVGVVGVETGSCLLLVDDLRFVVNH